MLAPAVLLVLEGAANATPCTNSISADVAVTEAPGLGVPRVFSGSGGHDGHSDTTGGWPTDTYYADLDGTWTDTGTYGAPANRHYNVPGDGMFDQNRPPSALELAVGRVDAEELSVFAPLTSTDLLRRYLDKNHAYRAGAVRLARRAWRTNTFGGSVGPYEVEPPTSGATP